MTTYPNWFSSYAEAYFTRHLSHLAGKPDLRFLQIGVFTGDASLWLLENVLTGDRSQLVDVDTWQGSAEPEHEPFDWEDVESTYLAKVMDYPPHRLQTFRGTSRDYFAEPHEPFDFIYIDGDHAAAGVLSDAVHAFDLLKPSDGRRSGSSGLIAFDDYLWKAHSGAETDAPGIAVDAFAACYADHIFPIATGPQSQHWYRKR